MRLLAQSCHEIEESESKDRERHEDASDVAELRRFAAEMVATSPRKVVASVVWNNGKIIEVLSGHEAMFFHYGGWKQIWCRAGRSEKWTEGRSWALMKQGLFMIKAEDTCGALQKVYEKHVERGKSPIVLELPWLRRTAHAIRARNPLRSRWNSMK